MNKSLGKILEEYRKLQSVIEAHLIMYDAGQKYDPTDTITLITEMLNRDAKRIKAMFEDDYGQPSLEEAEATVGVKPRGRVPSYGKLLYLHLGKLSVYCGKSDTEKDHIKKYEEAVGIIDAKLKRKEDSK